MTNNTKIKAAGYIVADENVIHAVGATVKEAWDNFLNTMGKIGVTVIDDIGGEKVTEDMIDNSHEYTFASKNEIFPASAALLADVEDMGGDIAWGTVGGVCCNCDGA